MLADFASALKKVGGEKYTEGGKWTKVFECAQENITNQQFDGMIQAAKEKGPLLLLLKGKEKEGNVQLTFGTFLKNQLPPQAKPITPSEELSNSDSSHLEIEIPQSD